MKPIKIEPGSGTKMAGKWIVNPKWVENHISPKDYEKEIIFISEKTMITRSRDGDESSWHIGLADSHAYENEWMEVDPPAPKKPKVVRKFPTTHQIKSLFCSLDDPDGHGLPIVIEYDESSIERIGERYTIRGKLFVEVPEEGEGK